MGGWDRWEQDLRLPLGQETWLRLAVPGDARTAVPGDARISPDSCARISPDSWGLSWDR